MALFIVSEIFFFVRFFWAFFHRRLSPNIEIGSLWPPFGIRVFNPFQVPLLNTIVLISSVIQSPCPVWEKFPSIKAWCAHVTLIPDEIRTIVFNRGTWKGLNTLIPNGGHSLPISTFGDSLLWKNAQKKLKKKNTSDTINNAMPQRNPSSVIEVCSP